MKTTPILVDSHIHLDQMTEDQRQWAFEEGSAGRYRALTPGVEPAQWQRALSTLGDHAWLDFAVGMHPWEVCDTKPPLEESAWLPALEEALAHSAVVAMGEIGLDKVRWESSEARARGEALFIRQLEIARAHELPVSLHIVRAHARAVELLKAHGQGLRGVVHAFAGSIEEHRAYSEIGFMVGFGSMVTRAHARRVRRAAAVAGAGTWLLETDAPFMTVGEARRGEGPSEGLQSVITAMADVRRAEEADVIEEAHQSYMSLFARCATK